MAGQTSVTPLTMSNVNWTHFIKNVAELTGHSPTHSIDNSQLKFGDCANFLIALGEFQSNKEEKPLDVLRNNDYLLRHLHFGFLISGSTASAFRILELTDLDVLTAKGKNKGRVIIITGTLKQWKDAIVICLGQKLVKNFELRWIFNQCLDCFYQAGLRNIFDDYKRKELEDQTYLLEYKK